MSQAMEVSRDRLVIVASTLGTVFEWYDFFVYGTLANVVAGHFFPSDNPAVSFLIFLASFGVGFGMRPLGAVLFGYLGDKLGRKYTFLVTIAAMGVATAAVGLLPTYESVGVLAPILLVTCRVVQGLALGGEYGGAAIYVAEHAPVAKRGFYTSFIQAGVIGGFLLRPHRRAAGVGIDERSRLGTMGLAHPVRLLAGAARRVTLDPPEAEGEPRLPRDEGFGRDRAQPAQGEL